MFICCEWCVLSGRGFCDNPITGPEENSDCGVSECDLETSWMRGPWPTGGLCAKNKRTPLYYILIPWWKDTHRANPVRCEQHQHRSKNCLEAKVCDKAMSQNLGKMRNVCCKAS
jgi:hypothetical protein